MPQTPYIINGTVFNSGIVGQPDVTITFTSSSGEDNVASDTKGNYAFDLANIGYSAGETITYSALDKFGNESDSGSFVVEGQNKTLNIILSQRTTGQPMRTNRDVMINSVGGNPISNDNPLPVTLVNTADVIDLTNNPETEFVYTRDDGQPDKETITVSGSMYERSFTYDSNGFLTKRSNWKKIA